MRQLGLLLGEQAFDRLPLDRIRFRRQESLKMRDVQVQYGSVHDMPLVLPVRRNLASGSDPIPRSGAVSSHELVYAIIGEVLFPVATVFNSGRQQRFKQEG